MKSKEVKIIGKEIEIKDRPFDETIEWSRAPIVKCTFNNDIWRVLYDGKYTFIGELIGTPKKIYKDLLGTINYNMPKYRFEKIKTFKSNMRTKINVIEIFIISFWRTFSPTRHFIYNDCLDKHIEPKQAFDVAYNYKK